MGKALVIVNSSLWKLLSPRPGEVVEVIRNDIPEDAELGSVALDPILGNFYVSVCSPSLPEPKDGEPLPYLNGPVFHTKKRA